MRRRKLPPVSEEMRRRTGLLVEQMRFWPEVQIGKMFGMVSVYRSARIFALLPATRAMERPNAIAVKWNSLTGKPTDEWQSLEVENDARLGEAMRWLEEGYRSAKKL